MRIYQANQLIRCSNTLYLRSHDNGITLGALDDGDRPNQNYTIFNGYVEEFRVIKSTAEWTNDFSVPTAPYVGDSSTPIPTSTPGGPTSTPTATPTATSSSGGETNNQDTYIDYNSQSATHGEDSTLNVQAYGPASESHHVRAFLQFNLNHYGSTASTAILKIHISNLVSGGGIKVFEVLEDWTDEGASWDDRMTGVPWGTEGGTLASEYIGSKVHTSSAENGWMSFNITPLFNDWINGIEDNHGIALVPGAMNLNVTFDSMDSSTQPYIEIDGQPPTATPTPPAMEFYLLDEVGIPFGFEGDPLPEYVPTQTTLSMKDLMYLGPCTVPVYDYGCVYGPNYVYTGKYDFNGEGWYWIPIHTWGVSYDTLWKLNTPELRNQMIQNPHDFQEQRYTAYRTRAWDDEGNYIFGIDELEAVKDGPDFFADVWNPPTGAWARKSEDGSVFHLWDHPGLTDKLVLDSLFPVDSALHYNNYVVHFSRKVNNDYEYQGVLNYHTRVLLRYDSECTWNLNGNAESGLGHILLPDWQGPPNGIEFP